MVQNWSHQENPADLNTKALSKERREYLAQLIGLHSGSFQPLSTPSVQRIVQMLVMAGWLKGRAPEADSCEGMRTTVRHSMWCILLLTFTVLFLLFAMSVMVFNAQKIRTSLSRYRIAWREMRAELNLRRDEDPMRLVGETGADGDGEGEEENDDEADGDEPCNDGDDDETGPGGGEMPGTQMCHWQVHHRRQPVIDVIHRGHGGGLRRSQKVTLLQVEETTVLQQRWIKKQRSDLTAACRVKPHTHTMESPEEERKDENERDAEEEESEQPSSSFGR